MCGIIAYLGSRQAMPIIVEGLRRLEHRGYDSAGLGIYDADQELVQVAKCSDRVDALVSGLNGTQMAGRLGIGHTRWATHGQPNQVNAHPHLDCSGRIVLVHNGIIENFAELKQRLVSQGHQFVSETDTEVLCHLVEQSYRGDFVAAVSEALGQVQGSYALAVYSSDHPQLLVGARMNVPLVVGLGVGEWFLASDMTAIIEHTRQMVVLDEHELVAITPSGVEVSSLDGVRRQPEVLTVGWDLEQTEKGGHPHFMLKEIMESAEAAANATRGRIAADGSDSMDELEAQVRLWSGLTGVRFVAMGTSLHAAMVGRCLIEQWAGLPCQADDASEFRYASPAIDGRTLVVAITQSGETADTVAALRFAKSLGAPTLAVTNVLGSTAGREAGAVFYLNAGPEIGVASSKTFVAHLMVNYLIALSLTSPDRMDRSQRAEIARLLHLVPQALTEVLSRSERIAAVVRRYSGHSNFMFIGKGLNYPIALEGALKLKEISYLAAQGYAAGELKHGPIALLHAGFPVIALATRAATHTKMASSVREIAARMAPVLAVVSDGDHSLDDVAADVLELPEVDELISPVVNATALQLFAYHMACELSRDVDHPRNLAKSVTVE